jgi:glycosyltransferase involved in cell wall biosynthesis
MELVPVVSVCMITYGHEDYIREAIVGVLMQECDFEIELIVVNDCSPDKTDTVIKNILENHPKASLINYIKHEQNMGMMPNFIFAMQECSGEYVALCEGDDYWTDPFKLQKQVDFLKANPKYVLCFHKVDILNKDGSIVDDFITKVPENYETKETLARLGNYIHTPSVVFRNVIKEFPLEFELSPIGDYFLYMLLVEHGKIKYLDVNMAVYRYGVGVHSGSSELKMATSNLFFFNCLLSYLENDELKKIFLEKQLIAIGNLEKAIRREYNESFVSNHWFFKALKIFNKNYKHPKILFRYMYYYLFR